MTTPRFNPEHGKDYGLCSDCGLSLPTAPEADDHMAATFTEAKANGGTSGHSVRINNPARPSRIQTEISQLVDDAIQTLLTNIDDLICRHHITEQEAATAIKQQHIDLTEEWDNYNS